jgi:hypothetical protein
MLELAAWCQERCLRPVAADWQRAFCPGLDILAMRRGGVYSAVPLRDALSLNEEWLARCGATRERQIGREPRKASLAFG